MDGDIVAGRYRAATPIRVGVENLAIPQRYLAVDLAATVAIQSGRQRHQVPASIDLPLK